MLSTTRPLEHHVLTVAQPALVTYVTAGYPTPQETPDILLAMEAGGAGKPRAAFYIA